MRRRPNTGERSLWQEQELVRRRADGGRSDAGVDGDEQDRPVGVLTRVRVLEVLAGPPFGQARGPLPENVEQVRGDAF